MTTIIVKDAIKKETTPTEDGCRLAAHMLAEKLSLSGLVLDVTSLAPEDLVSSFVNAFLHALEQEKADISAARQITWKARFPSETKRLQQLVKLYTEKPATNSHA